jgi:hypothetical protein
MPPIQPALLPGDSAADTRANVPALARLDVATLPGAVRARADVPDNAKPLRLGFTLPVPDGVTHLARTHPLVEALASYVIDTAYDDPSTAIARRCAAIRTSAVTERTILLVVRARFLIEEVRAHDTFPMLAEEFLLAAFDGDFARPRWLPDPAVEVLNRAEPTAPVQPGQGQHWIAQALDARSAWWPYLATLAVRRADELLAAHRRVRDVAHLRGVRYRVQPHPDLDLLGLYILMPGGRPA